MHRSRLRASVVQSMTRTTTDRLTGISSAQAHTTRRVSRGDRKPIGLERLVSQRFDEALCLTPMRARTRRIHPDQLSYAPLMYPSFPD